MATQTRVPTGDGDTNNYNFVAGGGAHYLDVDDAVGAPDDTTYVAAQGVNGRVELFTFAAFSLGSISGNPTLTVYSRNQRTAAGGNNITLRIKVNGTFYSGSAQAVGTTWAVVSETWANNPDTGAPWTQADIEGTGSNPLQQFGFVSTGVAAAEEQQTTQCYAEATYTPASGANPKGPLSNPFMGPFGGPI